MSAVRGAFRPLWWSERRRLQDCIESGVQKGHQFFLSGEGSFPIALKVQIAPHDWFLRPYRCKAHAGVASAGEYGE